MTNKKIQKLVRHAQEGQKEAVAQLYNIYFNQLYYFVYSRINNLHDTQEVVSDTFLSMVENINKFKGDSSFKNYLFGIAKNKMRDYIKNKYKSGSYILESTFDNDYFDNIVHEERDIRHRNKLRTVLNKIYTMMRPRYAKVLDLRYNQMNSIEETARILDTSTNNIKVLQHRAIKQASSIWGQLRKNGKRFGTRR